MRWQANKEVVKVNRALVHTAERGKLNSLTSHSLAS